MSTSSWRIGVVGLGNAAQSLHLPALKGISGATVVGGVDSNAERRASAGTQWGLTTFEDVGEMMRKASPDVVIVCTPPETHVAIGAAVMQQGAHLICEKPIAPSVEEAAKPFA